MHARDILSRPVVTVQPQMPLRSAVALLTAHGYAALPVVDDDDRVVGLLSESAALAASSHLETALVEAVMTVPVEVVNPGTDTSTIASRMLAGGLRSMPVVEAGVLVGIVARRDLLRALIRDDTTVEAKIRALLDEYAGSRRQWEIDSIDGEVTIRGIFADDSEERIVATLARTVDGVHGVETSDTGALRHR
ncbi:CBS domain-containing protein [Nocardia uniformis]|uniref:CBS domain-containing protein n=1 Tax=Nocardia uniformis TaxID=53432 RepID=A0A849BRR9_9NOCA|nr:CBS domain-containing protein [Nocardia uniformis]NNH69313.1 CBS domain-containing protein [Nocardia uniformis]